MLHFKTNTIKIWCISLVWRDLTVSVHLQIVNEKNKSGRKKKAVHTTEFVKNGGYHGNISKCQSVLVVMICYSCSAPFKHTISKKLAGINQPLQNLLQDNFIDEEAEEQKI